MTLFWKNGTAQATPGTERTRSVSVSRSGLLSPICSTMGSPTQIGARTLRRVEKVQVINPQNSDMP